MATAVELVRAFRRVRVLVVGDAMLDSYLEGTASRLCSEGPVPVVAKTTEVREPGGAANSAANLRALGAEVAFAGLVGADGAAALLRAALRERGVDDAGLVEDTAVGTLHKLRVLANGQYVVRFDEGDTRSASADGRARLLARIADALPLADVVVVADYHYGAVADDVLDLIRELRGRHPRPLVVDAKDVLRYRDAGATVLTPNHLEAQLAVERSAAPLLLRRDGRLDLDAVGRLARRLLARLDAEHVAVTLAADGVYVLARDGTAVHVPAHPVAEANDVGAGDSFTAALALALGAGAPMEEAVRIAIDCAGVAVAKRRTAVVTHRELLQRVSLRSHAADGRSTLSELIRQIEGASAAGRRVVFTNGVFDILHAGHVDFLRRAKALGDVLVVGVNSDASARRLKGKGRPINGEADRLALVAALGPVDHAVLFDEEVPSDLIRALRPHVHVKGGDYAGVPLPEAEAVRAVGGRVEILPLVDGVSTSRVIGRIAALFGGAAGAEVAG